MLYRFSLQLIFCSAQPFYGNYSSLFDIRFSSVQTLISHRGGSRIFFRRGCTRLLLYFNTNKPHIFFFGRIPVVLENSRSSRGGGGRRAHPLHPPPRSVHVSRVCLLVRMASKTVSRSISCLTCAITLTRVYATFTKLVSHSNGGITQIPKDRVVILPLEFLPCRSAHVRMEQGRSLEDALTWRM